jgi:hypothetical protein
MAISETTNERIVGVIRSYGFKEREPSLVQAVAPIQLGSGI